MKVTEVMKKPVFISSHDSLENAARLMSQNNLGGLLVGTSKKLEGIVTKEDLVKHFGHKELVSEIMTSSVVVLKSEEETDKALSILKKNAINLLPVVEKGMVIGVISSKDLLIKSDDEGEEFLFG